MDQEVSNNEMIRWRFAQYVSFLLGVAIFLALIFAPKLGLIVFWDLLIPLAPLIIVVIPGIWRNVCPIASVSLVCRHMGWSKKRRLSRRSQSIFSLIGLITLLLTIPLRHVIFNSNGFATAGLLLFLSIIAFLVGFFYDWKSAWCAGLCPVHQVENLYGCQTSVTFTNAHCGQCHNCSIPCPDSMRKMSDSEPKTKNWQSICRITLCGGFPGYIWGWFQIADIHRLSSIQELIWTYLLPFGGFSISLSLFLLMRYFKSFIPIKKLESAFIALAVSVYYGYRIPALIGFGLFPGDGMLLDLKGMLPFYVPTLLGILVTFFFFWWFLLKRTKVMSWLIRPQYARK